MPIQSSEYTSAVEEEDQFFDKSTHRVMESVAGMMKRICAYHDTLPPEQATSEFDAAAVPGISLHDYMDRMLRHLDCSPSCLVAAVMYADRLMLTGVPVTYRNVHKVLLCSTVVAIKVYEDVPRCMSDFALIGGVSVAELHRLELRLLGALQFDLHISPSQFEAFHEKLRAFAKQTKKSSAPRYAQCQQAQAVH